MVALLVYAELFLYTTNRKYLGSLEKGKSVNNCKVITIMLPEKLTECGLYQWIILFEIFPSPIHVW
jgi:hypothetical protein